MNNQPVKSATTAGILGIFLGNFGAHWWYLGNKKKALIHVGLLGGGVLLQIISWIVTAAMASSLSGLAAGLSGGFGVAGIMSTIGWMVVGANGIWGLVEGIQILSGGDAALATQGYHTAQANNNPAYGQPNPQGYAQPQYQQPYQQPNMAPQAYPQQGQPMPVQPVQPQYPDQSQQPQNNNGM